jgi:uncharacterized protein
MPRKRLCLIFLLVCFIAASCTSVDSSRFFALAALPRTGERAQNTAATDALTLAIGPIKFPGYLDRRALVKRLSQNRFAVADNDFWAEPLEENFSRILSENLSILLQTDRIVVYPWVRTQRPSYQVQVEVLRFEPNAEQLVELWARWMILDDTKKTIRLKDSYFSQPVKDKSTEASVAALSEAVADLSREISSALREIGAAKNPQKTATRRWFSIEMRIG